MSLAILSRSGEVLYRADGVMGEVLERAARERVRLDYADLSGEDLHGLNLSGLQATEALLIGANLARCLLTGANLCYATLDRAVMDEADLSFANVHGASIDPASARGMVNPDGSQWADVGSADDPRCCGEAVEWDWDYCPRCGRRI